jgi:hypothetical protein
MLLLAQSLLRTAGFEFDDIEDAWVARMPLPPLVVVESDEDRAYIREALLEVQAVCDAIGCIYDNFVVNARFVSVASPVSTAPLSSWDLAKDGRPNALEGRQRICYTSLHGHEGLGDRRGTRQMPRSRSACGNHSTVRFGLV